MRDEKRGLFFEALLLKKIEPKTAETVGAVGLNGNGTKMAQKKSQGIIWMSLRFFLEYAILYVCGIRAPT